MSERSVLTSAFHRLLNALVASIAILIPAAVGFLFLGPLGAMAGGIVGSLLLSAERARTNEEDAPPDRVSCQACGADNASSANYCHNCGVELETPDEDEMARKKSNGGVYYCDKCGIEVPEESESCPNCSREFR